MGIETLGSRIKRGWNAFINNRDPTYYQRDYGPSYSYRPDRTRYSRGSEKTIVTSLFNRIAIDVASLDFQHVRLDKEGRYIETIDSGLNNCLTLEANIDQSARAFIQDLVQSMLEEGVVAGAPIDTDYDPETKSFDVETMRTGKILEWKPAHVKLNVYNERTGRREDIIMAKRSIAILENPLYAVCNENNSTVRRLSRKLAILDAIDEQSGSGKLDLIIQLPYIIKTDARRQQAEARRKDIENQLAGSKYGIAYTDGTERITQLNRPVENNLMKQIEFLTSMAYAQLGMTQAVLDGTADEKTMLNYTTRTVGPIAQIIVDEFKRKFLTQTARTQRQSIMYFNDPFKLVPAGDLAEIADKFTRNEILSKNEVRQMIGRKPSSDPKADQLINSNISQPNAAEPANVSEVPDELDLQKLEEEIQNEVV